MSNLGILFWGGTAGICAFACVVLCYRSSPNRRWHALFFLYGGVFTGWLALDDISRIHENESITGIGEGYFIVVYAILLFIHVILFGEIILKKGFILLAMSLCFFLVAIIIDRFASAGPVWHRVGEDGFKFVGISLWAAFHFRAAWLTLVEDPRTSPHGAENLG